MLEGIELGLVKTIVEELPSDRTYLVGLRQEDAGTSLVQLDFCIGTADLNQETKRYAPLIQCSTNPQELTSEATIHYQARWERLCEITRKEGFKDPLEYLALTEVLDCSEKLPTGMHIVSGAMKYLHAFDSMLGAGKITHVGLQNGTPRPRNALNLAELRRISSSFFSGFTASDIQPEMRTTQH